jgi:hypothetical protein
MNIRSTEKRPASPDFEDMRGCVKAWTWTRMKSVLPLRTLSFRQRNNGLNSLSSSENELVTHTGSPPKTFVGERDSFLSRHRGEIHRVRSHFRNGRNELRPYTFTQSPRLT